MVDYTSFSRENFDLKEWVNSVINSDLQEVSEFDSNNTERTSVQPRLDSHISAVSTKLQILAQDIGDDLERNMIEIMGAVPRAMVELERLDNTAQSLHSGLENMTAGNFTPSSNDRALMESKATSASRVVALLSELDRVKRNMEACQATLVEAANWHLLVRQVQAKFASGDLVTMAGELEALQKSMAVLKHLPEASERAASFDRLQQQLEVLLKPQLLEALQAERPPSAVLAPYVETYTRLGRQEALQQEYVHARPAFLHKAWFAYGGTGKQELLRWFSQDFYEQVLHFIADEKKRCSALFGDGIATDVLCKVLIQVFQPLQSSMTGRTRETLHWPDIVQLYTATLTFLSKVFQQLDKGSTHNFLTIVRVITSPFHEFQDRLFDFEQGFLQTELQPQTSAVALHSQKVKNLWHASGSESILGIYLDSLVKLEKDVFDELDGSVKRCMSISSGFQGLSLVKVMSAVLCSNLQLGCSALRDIRSLLCSEKPAQKGSTIDGQPNDVDLLPSFQMQHLQCALQWLGFAGNIRLQLRACESRLGKRLRETYPLLFQDSTPSSSMSAEEIGALVGHLRLVEDAGRKAELRSLLTGTAESFLPGDLLAAPSRDCSSLASEAMLLMFDICFELIRSCFKQIQSMKCWEEESTEENIDRYSILPQSYMTQSGEHLLQLLQQLEPFANSDSLSDAAAAMDKNQQIRLGSAPWMQLASSLQLTDAEVSALRLVVDGSGFEKLDVLQKGTEIVGDQTESEGVGADQPQDTSGTPGKEPEGEVDTENEEINEAAQMFCNEWLSIFSLATTGAFLFEMTSIPRLSAKGSMHAATDTNYLMNIVDALDLPVHPMLSHLYALLEAPTEEIKAHVGTVSLGSSIAVKGIMRKFEQKMVETRCNSTLEL